MLQIWEKPSQAPQSGTTLAFLSRWSDKMLSAPIKLFMAVFSRRHFNVTAARALIKFKPNTGVFRRAIKGCRNAVPGNDLNSSLIPVYGHPGTCE